MNDSTCGKNVFNSEQHNTPGDTHEINEPLKNVPEL